ncbi:MAG: hypothetical protein ABFD49_11680 [Armatimonadota bacterium]|nr:PRELI/slowmo family protein [bacterium]
MGEHLFYGQRPLFVLIETSSILFVAACIGFAIGRIDSRRVEDRSQVGIIQTSILGLLALMLGFTFGVAFARFDWRMRLAVDEANALGTTFMRAQTLPEPYQARISRMLRKYVDIRIQTATLLENESKLIRVKSETEALQQEMWGQAAAAARRYPNPVTAVFLQTLNESIDLYATRVAAFRIRVPGTILWILAFIAIAGLAITGYNFGLIEQRSWLVLVLVSAMVAGVIMMTVDLDRPEIGPTRVSQQSMIDLRDSLSGFEVLSRKAK